MNGYRWSIFGVLGAQYLIVYFHRVAPAVVARELTQAFSISGASLGLLASAYFYPYAAMQIPVGLITDSWGAKKTIVLFSLIASVGTVLFGLSPGFKIALLSRAVVGFGLSAIFVAVMCILAEWFRAEELARVSGVLMAVGGVGWFSATTPLALSTVRLGWRASMILVGIVSVVITSLIWFFVQERPSQARGPIYSGNRGCEPEVQARPVMRDLKIISRDTSFWAIAVWFVMRGGALFGFFGLWAGPYLVDVHRLSQGAAGGILSMIAFAMIFGSPLIGHLSDRTLRSRSKVLVGTSVLNCICWLTMLIFFERLSVPWLFLLFFLLGVTISSVGTLAVVTAKELFPSEIAGTSMGAINLFPFVGAVIFQPFMGYVLDKAGKVGGMYQVHAYKTLLWVLFITSLVALASIMQCRETFKRN
ncbi:MAG TPA: MFS transporter [Syntrophorhabdaceae bacterium]|nr:MFS transporter [Syntrophorhabdaceae bacterium]